MTQPQTNPSASVPTPAAVATRGAASTAYDDAGTDPVTGLHRMSRTAGAGTQEYVAVNNVAVAALIFGIASFLALFDWTMVIVAITGVVLSVVALKQIRGSNGTQTGSMLAVVGLLLAVGFCGVRVVNRAMESRRTAADQREIIALVEQLGGAVNEERYEPAYAMFSDRFHERVPRTQFDGLWTAMHTSPAYGKAKMASNGRFAFDTDAETGVRTASSLIVVQPERSDTADRQQFYFRKIGGVWKIDNIPTWFPAPRPGPQQGGTPQQGDPSDTGGPPGPPLDPKLGPQLGT